MDFLKSAVASAIAKGSSFPYSLGDRVDIADSIWTLHNATKRVRKLSTYQSDAAHGHG
jgi:SCY1-like protein 1